MKRIDVVNITRRNLNLSYEVDTDTRIKINRKTYIAVVRNFDPITNAIRNTVRDFLT
jgi:hypothetical protein